MYKGTFVTTQFEAFWRSGTEKVSKSGGWSQKVSNWPPSPLIINADRMYCIHRIWGGLSVKRINFIDFVIKIDPLQTSDCTLTFMLSAGPGNESEAWHAHPTIYRRAVHALPGNVVENSHSVYTVSTALRSNTAGWRWLELDNLYIANGQLPFNCYTFFYYERNKSKLIRNFHHIIQWST